MALRNIDRTGEIYGRLKVIRRSPEHARAYWDCTCECGKSTTVRGDHLKEGRVQSCGCFSIESHSTHGMSRTPTYQCWRSMKERCTIPKTKGYKHYGGRGIEVCERWMESFSNFFDDMGSIPKGLTLDRINNDLGYSKDNCRWATRKQQVDNQRNTHKITHDGLTMCLKDWCRKLDVSYSTARGRIKRGKSPRQAIGIE